jgi:hypothetical protein
VLDSLAQALRLTPTETQYLYTLAGGRSGRDDQEPAPPPAPGSALRRMLDALNPNPAYLIGPSWDLLAWNAAEAGLIGDPARLPECERNLIRMVFTDARARSLMADHRAQAACLLAQFRADAARSLGEPGFERLRGELYGVSEEFRSLWNAQRVADSGSARWVFNHPRLGRLTVDYVRLAALETPGVRLFACFPADPETEAKLPGLLDPQQALGTAAAA